MAEIPDEKTSKLQLPLPNPLRNADIDCLRIAQALQLIDDWAAQGGGIVEFDSFAELPGVGEEKKIYLVLDTGRFYRWDDEGNAYVGVGAPGSTDDVPEGTTHLYFTVDRARAAQLHATASQLGVMRVGSGLVVNAEGVVSVVGGSGSAGLPSFNEMVLVPQTNGQTEFTISGGYTAGVIELFFNGVLIYGNGDDYTATDGSKIILTVGANTSDRLLLRRWTTASNLPFAALTDVPATLSGHGITDAVKSADFTFAKLGGKPTTLSGYGLESEVDAKVSAGSNLNSLAITYNTDGSVKTVVENSLTKTFAYNTDGSLKNVSWPVGAKTRTETYSYTGGVLSGMTATEV